MPRRILHRQHLNIVKAVTKEMQCISQTTVQSKKICIYIPLPKDLLPMPCKNTRKFYLKKYRLLACNTNYYMGTFPPFIVNLWNTLPPATLDQPNIAAKSKDELDRFYFFNRFSLTSVFNYQFLCMQCTFYFTIIFWYVIIILYPRNGYRLRGLIK